MILLLLLRPTTTTTTTTTTTYYYFYYYTLKQWLLKKQQQPPNPSSLQARKFCNVVMTPYRCPRDDAGGDDVSADVIADVNLQLVSDDLRHGPVDAHPAPSLGAGGDDSGQVSLGAGGDDSGQVSLQSWR